MTHDELDAAMRDKVRDYCALTGLQPTEHGRRLLANLFCCVYHQGACQALDDFGQRLQQLNEERKAS